MKKKGKSINKLNRNFITSVGLISAFFVTGALAYAINQSLLGNSSSAASWGGIGLRGGTPSTRSSSSTLTQPNTGTGVVSLGKAPEGTQPNTEGQGNSGEETACQKRCEDQCDKKYNAATQREAWRGCVNDCMIAAGCKDAPQGALNCSSYNWSNGPNSNWCKPGNKAGECDMSIHQGCYAFYTCSADGTAKFFYFDNPQCK